MSQRVHITPLFESCAGLLSAGFTKSSLVLFLLLTFLFILPEKTFSSGFGITTQGAKAIAMGNAFVATADDPSAIAYNPAGIALSRNTELYLGSSPIISSTEFTNPNGQTENAEVEVFFPPHLYVVSPLGSESMTFGVGIFSPFGLGKKWSDTGLTRYKATESEIQTFSINPTLSLRIFPSLLVGGGVNYMKSSAELKKMVDQSAVGGNDGEFTLSADGDGWGYHLGILFIPLEQLSIGLAYRSEVAVDYEGTATLDTIAPALQPLFGGSRYTTNASTTLHYPAVASVGIAIKPIKDLTLELDGEWTGWSSYDSLNINLENEVPAGGLTDSSEPKEWKDVWSVKLGLDYHASESLSLRAGYLYENNPVPDHTLDPRLPDSDRYALSLGLGFLANNFSLDVAYMGLFFEKRTVNNTVLSGTYENFIHVIGLSAGYRF